MLCIVVDNENEKYLQCSFVTVMLLVIKGNVINYVVYIGYYRSK